MNNNLHHLITMNTSTDSQTEERTFKQYELDFKTEQINGITFKTSCVDMDYLGWRYIFPTEGIVVVVKTFDHLMDHIMNWKLCRFLDHEDISLNLFVTNPMIQILTWDEFG